MMKYMNKCKIGAGVVGFGMLLGTAAHADSTGMMNREYLSQLYFGHMHLESQDWDIEDANYLQGAGKNALDGGLIGPRDWRGQHLVTATGEELETARRKLVYAMDSGAANNQPKVFAHALVGYDCWVGQVDAEPNASHNTTRCRDEYYKYAASLPDPMTTQQVTETAVVPTAMKELMKVYFAWDRYDLSTEAKAKLDEMHDSIVDARNGKLVIGGYADASGSRDYNMELSRKRAQAVADYLRLPADRYEIDLRAFGEDSLIVPTADGVREQRNRVAIIGVRVIKDVTVEQTKTIQVTE